MINLEKIRSVNPSTPLSAVLEKMSVKNINQLPVMEDGKLLGLVARDKVLDFIQLRTELDINKNS